MLAKLALRNVRRSVRDYAVYFVTLVFGVAAFYAFNSIKSQQVLFDLEQSGSAEVFEMTGEFMLLFSVAVALTLGFLIVYANRFLIRRRKREFGTYLLLGMRPGQVSAIVLMETAVVGAVSLVVGLLLGVGASQGMAFFTAWLFGVPVSRYEFVFSGDAFLLTLACFAAIYAIVALFNTLQVRRSKLADLLAARSRSERLVVRNPLVSFVAFLASLLVLALAYRTLQEDGLVMMGSDMFWQATGLMVVGTLLFFWSLAGFVVAVVQRVPSLYLRGVRMFTLRQFAAKVNTAFASLSVVCVLLFLSLTTFSVGMGLVDMFFGNLEEGTVFDATVTANVYQADPEDEWNEGATPEALEELAAVNADRQAWDGDLAAKMAAEVPGWGTFVKDAAQVDFYYAPDLTLGQVTSDLGIELPSGAIENQEDSLSLPVIKESQFNVARVAAGREPVDLGENGFAVNSTVEALKGAAGELAASDYVVRLGGRELASVQDEPLSQGLMVTSVMADAFELIVPDEVVDAMGVAPYSTYVNLVYSVDRVQGDRMLEEGLAAAYPPSEELASFGWSYDTAAWPVSFISTAEEVYESANSMRLMITYLALYIGLVLLVTTAAVLAIQQLSETSDALPRYRTLAELGCDGRMLNVSLGVQTAVYFLAPLCLAACHTACAVGVVSSGLLGYFGTDADSAIALAAVMTAVVYGAYLLATFFASRSIMRASLGKRLAS